MEFKTKWYYVRKKDNKFEIIKILNAKHLTTEVAKYKIIYTDFPEEQKEQDDYELELIKTRYSDEKEIKQQFNIYKHRMNWYSSHANEFSDAGPDLTDVIETIFRLE